MACTSVIQRYVFFVSCGETITLLSFVKWDMPRKITNEKMSKDYVEFRINVYILDDMEEEIHGVL